MTKNDRLPDAVYFDDKSLTQQNAKDECDINLIVESAKRGADISGSLARGVPRYGDFTNLPSYQDSLNMVIKAKEMFMSLDAFVRERFANDPGRLMDFLDNPANRDEAIKLGLVQPPPVAVPPLVPVKDKVSEGRVKAKPDNDD